LPRRSLGSVPSWPPASDLEDAEPGQADFGPFLEVPGRQRHQIAQYGLRLLLRQVMVVRQRGGQMLEREGGLSLGWGCFFAGGMMISLGRFAAGNLLTPTGFEQLN
jgi:hypothetical protein